MDFSKSPFFSKWKKEAAHIMRATYSTAQLSDEALDAYLNKKIEAMYKEHMVVIVNNYNETMYRMSVLNMVDMIERRQFIIGAAGCIYTQHHDETNKANTGARNLYIEFIQHVMAQRSWAKKERGKYEKYSDEWMMYDRLQNAFKLIINALYGCMGYPGFTTFNIFIAETITTMGRHIITSAINGIENFLGDYMHHANSNDVFNFISNVRHDFFNKTSRFTPELLLEIGSQIDIENAHHLVFDRITDRCAFAQEDTFQTNLMHTLKTIEPEVLILLYYKNNLDAFSRLPTMANNYRELILHNGMQMSSEDYDYKDDKSRAIVDSMWKLLDYFVHYDHPIHDRIRKAMYLDKKNSLYTDTDSCFMSVNKIVRYVYDDIFGTAEAANLTEQELTVTAANIGITFANRMINAAMWTLCKSLNITDKYAKLLKMKNEFFLPRIMFFDVKKRYVANALMQEGAILGKGEGIIEIKGMDFNKAGTKPRVRDEYKDILYNDILKPKTINTPKIFKRLMGFQEEMRNDIENGDDSYFKQTSVKLPANYKNPYSTQGVVATMCWNALMPDKVIELPSDVNIVPIKPLTFAKPTVKANVDYDDPIAVSRIISKTPLDYPNIAKFAELYPEQYRGLFDTIYGNSNLDIRHMGLGYIAIPRVMDYELPEHIRYLMDVDKIVNANIMLFHPIMTQLGMPPMAVSSSNERLTNIIL